MCDFVTSKPASAHQFLYPIYSYVTCSKLSPLPHQDIFVYSYIIEPSSFLRDFKDPPWIEAMKLEIAALERNKIWSIIDLPSSKVPVGCILVYKAKYRSSGVVERYKARIVAKGYSQKIGVDYSDTFSPVAKMVTVRSLITLVASR